MLKAIAATLTTITAVIAGILGILKYFQYRTRRDKVMLVRQAFETVVKSLASNVEVERMAGAILLRRFFDSKTEVGIANTPYSKEAVDVAAAILRGQVSGNFQKLLADGLAYAPTLVKADLQRTNLQFAYLGPLGKTLTDVSHADFYRADLSKASLRGANAYSAKFYQARMHNTVLTGANLQKANFFEADLKGAKFDGALLHGAVFKCARNLPTALAENLDENGVYTDSKPFESPKVPYETTEIRVFISKPGFLDFQQQHCLNVLLSRLEAAGMSPRTLERADYPQFGTIGEIQRLMTDCAGVIILGFKQLEVRDGLWRSSTPEEQTVKDQYFPTPWNQIEAGMATMLGLPILVVCQPGVNGGIFDNSVVERQVYRVSVDEDWNATANLNALHDWCSDVREQARSS
jgi:uncharacterized protein YjbI with pentapeptide repeats